MIFLFMGDGFLTVAQVNQNTYIISRSCSIMNSSLGKGGIMECHLQLTYLFILAWSQISTAVQQEREACGISGKALMNFSPLPLGCVNSTIVINTGLQEDIPPPLSLTQPYRKIYHHRLAPPFSLLLRSKLSCPRLLLLQKEREEAKATLQ